VRLDDAIEWFLESWPYEGPRLPSRETVRTYRTHLLWLADFAASRHRFYVAELDASLLRQAFRAIFADSTARNFKGGEAKAKGVTFAARALAAWLARQRVEVKDVSAVKPPRVPERIQPRVRPDEFSALEHAVLRRLVDGTTRAPRFTIARDLALLYLLSDTGLRADEVCNMHVSDVDFSQAVVTVRRGKGGKQRALSVADASDPSGGATLRRLREWVDIRATVARCQEHDALWTSVRGTPLGSGQLRYVLARICKRAGLDSNRPPHTFRRASFTERYKENPASVDVLVSRMGWSKNSRAMIDTYTRGAELDFAATEPLPSLAGRWHSGYRPKREGGNGRGIRQDVVPTVPVDLHPQRQRSRSQ
jgi:site-specific recombinase XerD